MSNTTPMRGTRRALDQRIRALTTLLFSMHRESGKTSFPSGRPQQLVDFYTHVATTLTRGTEDSKGQAEETVAVSGYVSTNDSKEKGEEKRKELHVVALAQNSFDPKKLALDSQKWPISNVTPAHEAWRMLQECEINRETFQKLGMLTTEPLLNHAERVLAALKDSVKPSRAADSFNHLFNFFLHSCYRETLSRLKIDETTIFRGCDITFANILATRWELTDGDLAVPRLLTMPQRAVKALMQYWGLDEPVPRLKNSEGRCVLNRENADFWVKSAGYAINVALSSCEKYNDIRQAMMLSTPSDTSVVNVNVFGVTLQTLWLLVRHSGSFYETLMNIPSLQNLILESFRHSQSLWSSMPHENADEVRFYREDTPTQHVLRYLENCVVLVEAVETLPHVSAFKKLDTRVSLITTQSSVDGVPKQSDFSDILLRGHFPNLEPEALASLAQSVSLPKEPPTVHAEATLMSILAPGAQMNSDPGSLSHMPDPDLKLVKLVTGQSFDKPKFIGVGKKCCFCCHWLASKLKFDVPDTHGIIFPWVPPPGLDLTTLQALVTQLETKLKEDLPGYLAYLDAKNAPMSVQSSPEDSHFGFYPDLVDRPC